MITLTASRRLLAGGLMLCFVRPAAAAEGPIVTCGTAYARLEASFVRAALRLGWLTCAQPDRLQARAGELARTTNERIAAFNARYAAPDCDPDVPLPLPAKTAADVVRVVQAHLRSVPLDRFCNGEDDGDPLCGNGQQDAGEACDGGDLAGQTCEGLGHGTGPLACAPDCRGFELAGCSGPPYCGNGSVDPPVEQCDTFGPSATCDVDCTLPVCGDGLANREAGEECDDGNSIAGDGCSHACQYDSVCGNGRVEPDNEEVCDVAGQTAACDWDCTLPVCGDGLANTAAGERCDDGNTIDGDGCSSACTFE